MMRFNQVNQPRDYSMRPQPGLMIGPPPGLEEVRPGSHVRHGESRTHSDVEPDDPDGGKVFGPPTGPVNSLMIRHLPCSVTEDELRKAIDNKGFAGKYDFLHVPLRGPARNRSNCGYGFVDFPNKQD